MKKLFVIAVLLFMVAATTSAQKYFTKSGKINFDATAQNSTEIIEAVNRSVVCVVDSKTGAMQFSVLMKGFEFERALMQEHFNENYVESEKFPNTIFKGQIANSEKINYSKDGTYPVSVKGKLTIHGETKEVVAEGKLIVQNGKITTNTVFSIELKDYKISIPGVVANQISKTVTIHVACLLELLKN